MHALYIRTDIKPERVLSGLFTAITEMQYTKIRDVYLQAPRNASVSPFKREWSFWAFLQTKMTEFSTLSYT